MYVLEVRSQTKGISTLFIKLKDFFPECFYLISDSEQLYPLICLDPSAGFCPRNANCMSKLAARVKFIFDKFTNAELLILYFTYRNLPGRMRAGVFWRDMEEPRFIKINKSAWELVKTKGEIYEIHFPDTLLLGGHKLLPVLP